MERKNWIAVGVLGLVLSAGALTGCASMGEGEQGIEALEQMSDLEYSKWQLYITLGVKIASNRALAEGVVSADELDLAATALETLQVQTIMPGATSLILPALEDVGLTSEEVQLLLLIVEQELLARGALEWLDPQTGLVAISPRTKEMLGVVAGALRSATALSEEEVIEGEALEAEYQGQIISSYRREGRCGGKI